MYLHDVKESDRDIYEEENDQRKGKRGSSKKNQNEGQLDHNVERFELVDLFSYCLELACLFRVFHFVDLLCFPANVLIRLSLPSILPRLISCSFLIYLILEKPDKCTDCGNDYQDEPHKDDSSLHISKLAHEKGSSLTISLNYRIS